MSTSLRLQLELYTQQLQTLPAGNLQSLQAACDPFPTAHLAIRMSHRTLIVILRLVSFSSQILSFFFFPSPSHQYRLQFEGTEL